MVQNSNFLWVRFQFNWGRSVWGITLIRAQIYIIDHRILSKVSSNASFADYLKKIILYLFELDKKPGVLLK